MGKIGIRLEDKNRWERRVPIVPADAAALSQEHGIEWLVQPFPRRVYEDERYQAVGARLTSDLSAAQVILSVKEVPIELLLPGKTYVFFAHVIKGQPYNMPLLRRLLDRGCTLIDYEPITDEQGKRLVLFGREAGQAGMIDTLHVLGRRLAAEGRKTPLADIRQAYEYADLAAATAHFDEVGERIRRTGLGVGDLPMVVGFTGRGNVSQGAMQVFDHLPFEDVSAEDLADIVSRHEDVDDRIFKVCFEKHHLVQPRRTGAPFDGAEYREHPERYRDRFIDFLPYLTVWMNGIFWTDKYPRYFTKEQAQTLWQTGERKLRIIGDVTCDIDGAIELTHKSTTPDHPTFVYDPLRDACEDGFEGDGIIVMAVDNLPCELPKDASDNFSRSLRDFVPALAKADYNRPFEELDLPPEIERAVICHRGELTPRFAYLQKFLDRA